MNKQAEDKEIIEHKDSFPVENDERPSCDIHEPDRPFDIGDHLKRVLKMMDLVSGDHRGGGGPGMGLMKLLKRMTMPSMMDFLPFGGETLGDNDRGKMNNVHHKIVMVIGKPKEARIDSDDIEDIEEVSDSVEGKVAAMRDVLNIKVAARTMVSPEDAADSVTRLSNAFLVALRCADKTTVGEPAEDDVVSIIRACNPVKHRRVASKDTMNILSGIVADTSAYTDAPAFWRSIATRIKLAYRNMMDENVDAMEKEAFVVTRNPVEDFTGRQGFNICPKFKTATNAKAAVPVEHSYCRDYCVEGRPEPDGTVTCKYAKWLDTIDTHEMAMARYPELKNPANDDMKMNLPDGQRYFPRKANAYSIEQRMQGERLNSTKRDATTNLERQIGDAKKPSLRSEDGQFETTEEKLVMSRGKRKAPADTTESRLGDKRDDSSHGVGPENAMESRIREAFSGDEFKFDRRKLIDELLEDAFPRKDSERPQEG